MITRIQNKDLEEEAKYLDNYIASIINKEEKLLIELICKRDIYNDAYKLFLADKKLDDAVVRYNTVTASLSIVEKELELLLLKNKIE